MLGFTPLSNHSSFQQLQFLSMDSPRAIFSSAGQSGGRKQQPHSGANWMKQTAQTGSPTHILFVKRKGANLVTAKAGRTMGTELGGRNQAEIAAEESNLADLVVVLVCCHTAPAMLGVEGEAASMANANAIARTI